MANRPRARRNDGVTMTTGASPGKSLVLLAAAVALACLALLVLFGRPPAQRPPAGAAPAAAADEPERAPAAPAPDPGEAASDAPAPRAPEPAAEREAEPEGESAPFVPSGIGLFPPPGTDPIKVGIVVPDDYELPEGYLRHYQVTDDGQDLAPILLFHPDYEVKGPDGRPLPLPPDRVVPPELAPPGLPIQMLEIPEPLEEEGDLRLPLPAGDDD
jgi:hypothetical protein